MKFANFVPENFLRLIHPQAWGKINPMKAFLEARKRILGLVAIIILVLVMLNLNSRLGEYFRLDSQRDSMSTQMAELRLTHDMLETQVAYATSDQAVEDWARNEAHEAQEGDKVVIVITPPGNTVVPPVVETPAPRVVQNWEVWWALFFGD
jgi:cell division protein FtsB